MTPTNAAHSWTPRQRLARLLVIFGILIMFILPCPGPVISKQIAELIKKITLIQSGEGLYLVPLRWCSVEGSPSEANPGGLGFADTDSIFIHRMLSANDHFWVPGAEIGFQSAFTYRLEESATFPVIPDHYPPPNGAGTRGDINLDRYGFYEGSISPIELVHQIADCELAWDALELEHETNLEGIIALNVNHFVGNSGVQSTTAGIATSAVNCDPGLDATSDICTDLSTMADNIGAFVALEDASRNQSIQDPDFRDVTLAHEMGHTLFLGHGDGLDNDGNGLFDSCCDADENENAAPYSLMSPYSSQASSGTITDLQKDWARTVASLTPGLLIDPPAYYMDGKVISDRRVDQLQDTDDVTADLVWAGMSENPNSKTAVISFKLLGIIDGKVDYQYVMFVDLDNNPETGGTPDSLGFSTEFRGAEAVAVVHVSRESDLKETSVEPVLWVEKNGKFTEAPDFRLAAAVTTIHEAETRVPMFDIIGLEFPTSVIGPIEDIVRFQALSQNTEGVVFDYLPDPGKNESAVLYMTAPKYPGCAVTPTKAAPGETVSVEAWGLVPEKDAEVYAARQVLAAADVDKDGGILLDLSLPEDLAAGQQLLTVRSKGTGLTADCALEVTDPNQLDVYGTAVTVVKIGVLAASGFYIFRAGLRKFRS